MELLDNSGKLSNVAWNSIKWVCWVRELEPSGSSERDHPERLLRRRFSSRPRSPGLWLRITFKDGDELEGVVANDLSLIAGIGLLLTPPDTRSNTQRVFVPHSAVRELTILAVIPPAKPPQPSSQDRQAHTNLQPDLFANES